MWRATLWESSQWGLSEWMSKQSEPSLWPTDTQFLLWSELPSIVIIGSLMPESSTTNGQGAVDPSANRIRSGWWTILFCAGLVNQAVAQDTPNRELMNRIREQLNRR